ncbi:hypothetical protein [Actinoalloteichus spitiensis]|uniref:hypothetical protein n=1 Tax=Actinoalloteichus spitiensis TaxID=252394 RepID=UPI0003771B98|nr:hypothetical protein [Actinoalloteichus spitiensis]
MEIWRMAATALLVLFGGILVLVVMAQARDRKGRSRGDVARNGAIASAVLVVAVLGVALWLPSTVAWGLVAAAGIAVAVLTMVD